MEEETFRTLKNGEPLTRCCEGQPIIRAAGFDGNEEITQHTHGDEKGEEDHSSDGETNQSPDTEKTDK